MNEADRHIVIGECKRNPEKINSQKLTEKAAKTIDHHKSYTYEIVGVSMEDM